MFEPTTLILPEVPAVVRRPAASRFISRGNIPPPEAPLAQRNVLWSSHDKGKILTGREWPIAGDLPEQESLPPGELLVKRGSV